MIKDKKAQTVMCIIAALIIAVFLTPLVISWSPTETNFMNRNKAPGEGHIFGTDSMGRDTFARILGGGKISILVGAAGMLSALFIGGVLGLLACAAGGIIKSAYFGFIDLLRSMPGPLLAITLVISLGQGMVPVIIAIGFIYSPMFARIARSLFQREAAMDYILYSKANGASSVYILRHHILPNITGAFITQAAIVYPRAIVTESVLSFLGMGVSPETPTWGKMISIESPFFESNPIAVLAPVFVLTLFTALFAILGTILREAE